MNEYKFCPYCGKPFDYSKQDIVDNYLCTYCGEIVVNPLKLFKKKLNRLNVSENIMKNDSIHLECMSSRT